MGTNTVSDTQAHAAASSTRLTLSSPRADKKVGFGRGKCHTARRWDAKTVLAFPWCAAQEFYCCDHIALGARGLR
eukprot:SAG31_NODE_801_length_12013_cov_23.812070_19_plen_75_part_00